MARPSLTCDLELPQMVPEDQSTEMESTAHTASLSTQLAPRPGIWTNDRALTCRSPASPTASFRRPGYLFPLRRWRRENAGDDTYRGDH